MSRVPCEDARRQRYEEIDYLSAWRRHQFSEESGRPTRSASSPVEARAWAGAATAAPAHGASHTEMQPAPLISVDEAHPVADPYPTPSPAYIEALAILSSTIRIARTA